METIFWISVGLLALAIISVAIVVRQHNRMFKDHEDPVPLDDMPGHYEDYEMAEMPFYNP